MYIQITDVCNMRCPHCCFSCTGKGSFMEQEVFDACLNIVKNYESECTIGGGEPTLHPKILDWLMQAMFECEDISCDKESPNVWLATNGSQTEIAIKISKMARLGMISATLSQDPWHDPIDYEVIKAFSQKSNYLSIRDVSKNGALGVGRAKENNIYKKEGCACEDFFVAPNGDIYQCGCQITKICTIFEFENLERKLRNKLLTEILCERKGKYE